jgi:hypothetical protein
MASVPEVGSVERYLQRGPGFIFLHHPALGPLWDVIAQKIRGGTLAQVRPCACRACGLLLGEPLELWQSMQRWARQSCTCLALRWQLTAAPARRPLQGSELVLEVAEARLVNVSVDGSLLVYAQNVLGHFEEQEQGEGQASSSSGSSGGGSAAAGHLQGSSGGAGLGNNIAAWSRGSRGQQQEQQQQQQLPPSAGNPFAAASGGSPYGAGGQRLVYSSRCGRINLQNVWVHNVGVDWLHEGNVHWRHRVARHEACRVLLHGRCAPLRSPRLHAPWPVPCAAPVPACQPASPSLARRARRCARWAPDPPPSPRRCARWAPHPPPPRPRPAPATRARRSEFEARDVLISGDLVFEVPDGWRMVLSPDPAGGPGFRQQLLPLQGELPSWQWQYRQGARGEVLLAYQQHEPAADAAASEAASEEPVFHYVI